MSSWNWQHWIFRPKGTDIRFVESLRNTGFGVLENHPLDLDLIASIYEHWSDFFKSGRAILICVEPGYPGWVFLHERCRICQGL